MGRSIHERWPDTPYQLHRYSPQFDKFDLESHRTST